MTTPSAKVTPLRKPVECPQCGKPSCRTNYPFCSDRCADLDLGKWLGGGYSIQTEEAPGEEK
ncbi:MAG: DNA gyrase inhibitor YacG [Pseudomonadota bacterium]